MITSIKCILRLEDSCKQMEYYIEDQDSNFHKITSHWLMEYHHLITEYYRCRKYMQAANSKWPSFLKNILNGDQLIELELKGYPI